MNRLVLDSIILGLQRFGGISNFWTRLIEAAGPASWLEQIDLVMPKSIQVQEMPDLTGKRVYTELLSQRVSRYLPVRGAPRGGIFHTSYYRQPGRPVDRYLTSVYDFTYERYFHGLAKTVHHVQKRASIHAADLSICISEATRADLLSYFPKVDPANTCVVPLGVDRSAFFPDIGGVNSAPYVLFVGQRSGYKRFDLAVGAVSLAGGLHLAIVGPPLTSDETAQLEQALPGRWIKTRKRPARELATPYSAAYAFIFPSDYEGFGLPILEAMACGCPTIAANRSSFPEVAGQAALLAVDQSTEAYAMLLVQLEDESHRSRLVAAGEARVALFDWGRTFSALWDHYQ